MLKASESRTSESNATLEGPFYEVWFYAVGTVNLPPVSEYRKETPIPAVNILKYGAFPSTSRPIRNLQASITASNVGTATISLLSCFCEFTISIRTFFWHYSVTGGDSK